MPPAEAADEQPQAAGHSRTRTTQGKALLAALPRAVRRRYLDAHGMARLTERTITDAERFEAELDRVRAEGLFHGHSPSAWERTGM